jgi:hypothetical protein
MGAAAACLSSSSPTPSSNLSPYTHTQTRAVTDVPRRCLRLVQVSIQPSPGVHPIGSVDVVHPTGTARAQLRRRVARRRTVPPPHMSPQAHAERIDAAATRSVKFLFLHHTVSAVEVPRSIQSPGRSPLVDGDVAPTHASQIHLLVLRSNATQDGPYVYASASARVIVLVPTGHARAGLVALRIV